MMDYNEFAEKIKSKYPDYKDIDNLELSQKMLAKYPEYTSEVSLPSEPATQKKPESLVEKFGKWLPTAGAIGGGFAGGAVGAGVLSLPAGAAGAAAGAAAGKGLQEALYAGTEALYPGTISKPQTTAQKFYEPAIEAGTQLLGGKILQGGVAALKMLAPQGKAIAAQLLTAFPAIRLKDAIAVSENPSILSKALPMDVSKKQFGEFIKKSGYEYGAKAVDMVTGDLSLGTKESIRLLKDTFKTINFAQHIKGVDSPELVQKALATKYSMGKQLRIKNWYDNESERYEAVKMLNTVEDYLETKLPGFAEQNKQYWMSKVAEQFKSALPLNKNLSPNVLRTTTALGLAVKGISEGKPLYGLIPASISPYVTGLAVKGVGLAGQAGSAISQTGIPQAGYRGGVSMISDMINKAFENHSRSAPGPR